jgi:hypothetical protein
MSTPELTLAQFMNQKHTVVAVAASGLKQAGEQLLMRSNLGLSLRVADIAVPTITVRDRAQLDAAQFCHEHDYVWVIRLGDTPVKQATDALQAGFETAFIQSARLGIAHLDWNEGRWLRDFPKGDARPFAPWLDYLEHLRGIVQLGLLGPDARLLLGDPDV